MLEETAEPMEEITDGASVACEEPIDDPSAEPMAEPMDEAMEVTGTGAIVAPEASMDDNTEEATDVATDVAIAAPEEPMVDAIDVPMADTMTESIV
jgi:hypothetical protein